MNTLVVNNWLLLAQAFLLYMVIVYRNANTCIVYKDQCDPGCTTTRHNMWYVSTWKEWYKGSVSLW